MNPYPGEPTPLRPGALTPESLVYPFPVPVLDALGRPTKEVRYNVSICKLDEAAKKEAARIVEQRGAR